jgi:predicted glycoside hydrolase/deacetylase ChbG (UPF0249 family)
MSGPRRLLIVNADDYGLTEGISRGILHAHRHGVVTSTSVLANAPALDRVAGWLREQPTLGVGVHLALVGEDPPLLSTREIPTLIDGRGRFPASWRSFLLRAAARRIDRADLRRELGAQIERVRGLGVRPTHLDTHQHLHLWPLVAAVVTELASEQAVPAIRVPRSRGRRAAGMLVAPLAAALAHRADACGLSYPAWAAGFDEAGQLDRRRLGDTLATLARRAAPSVELCAHPGEPDDAERARYRWGYRWPEELEALCHPGTRQAILRHGFTLGSYAELVRTGQAHPVEGQDLKS